VLASALQSTQCERCPAIKSSSPSSSSNNNNNNNNNRNSDDINRPYHVVIFMTDDQIEYMSLAAALLAENFTVTILHFREFTKIDNLQDRILSRLSCSQEALVVKDERLFLLDMSPSEGEGDYFQQHANNNNNNNHQQNSCRVTAAEPFDMCTIEGASKHIQQIYSLLGRQNANGIPIPLPDVLVMDVTFVPGLLLSELSFIPTVAIASPHALDLAIEHDPAWTPNEEWHLLYRLYRIVRQRLYSLSLTRSFLAMNAVRNRIGRAVRLLKTPADYLYPVVALILEDVPHKVIPLPQTTRTTRTTATMDSNNNNRWQQQRAIVTGSLQPPCVPCLVDETPQPSKTTFIKKSSSSSSSSKTSKKPPPTVMVWPSPDISPASVRALIRGIILARGSLDSYDECEWDSLSCRNEGTDFEILWLDDDEYNNHNNNKGGYFPDVVPSYVKKESSVSLLDSLARHNHTIAVLAHCDSTSMALPLFGVSLLCVSQSDRGDPLERLPVGPDGEMDPREVAVQLLRLLRERNKNNHNHNAEGGETMISSLPNKNRNNEHQRWLDGMTRAVAVLRQVAVSHRDHGPWMTLSQMQEVSTLAARDALFENKHPSSSSIIEEPSFFDEQHPYDTFTVLVAWLVLLSCTVYVIIKDSVLSRLRPRRPRGGEAFSDGILSRMPDLDDAAATFLQWCRDQTPLVVHNNNSVPTARSSSNTDSNNNHRGMHSLGGHSQPHSNTGGNNNNNNSNNHNRSQGQANMRRRRKR
jgi:hypothetical protein